MLSDAERDALEDIRDNIARVWATIHNALPPLRAVVEAELRE